ncbi:probetacellulin-like isoform X3 [Hemiscyllium ocellatum]|uniref:probetacellulin-like isoform X3 n=1 Tax=Hemiscyllium ocellatum TaxID=170820 RepID=UPI002966675F|nr:probetacellulin-like isoform X3 [Hemiscyllium ocellatum]
MQLQLLRADGMWQRGLTTLLLTTASLTEIPQTGHFTKCPKELMSYCLEGECRFMQSENKPSCVCKFGYVGSRCEFLDVFYRTGKRDQFIVVGLVLAILLLMIAIIVICFCVHRFCRKHKAHKKRREEAEILSSKPLDGKDSRGEGEDTAMTTLA